MAENKIVSDARHFFKNCKAAFRLLQGALLSGHYTLTTESRNTLIKTFVELENRVYSENDQSLFEVQSFFSNLDKLKAECKSESKALKKLNLRDRTIVIVDDQFEKCGWKESLEFIFGKNVKGFDNIKALNDFISHIGVHEKKAILVILIDLNFGLKESLNSDGVSLITELCQTIPSIPLVAFTAYDSTIWVKKAFDAGAWDYFSKDPDDKEAKEYKNAIEYYSQCISLVETYDKYNSKFISLYAKVNRIERSIARLNLMDDLTDKMIECLWMAYRYCVLDYAIRFSPGFFDESKEQEVIFQSAKAFEYFLVILFNKFQLTPKIPPTNTYSHFGVMINGKLQLLKENNDKFRLSEDWFKNAATINTKRNKIIHGDTFSISKNRFIINPSQINEEISRRDFDEILGLILTGLDNLT